MSRRRNFGLVAALVGLVLLFVATRFPSIYADYLWFASLGYDPVFVKVIIYRTVTFVAFSLVAFVGLYAGYRFAVRNVRKYKPYRPSAWFTVGVVFGALAIGATFTNSWETFLLFLNGEPFLEGGEVVADPYFGNPVSFYVFTLPALSLAVGYLTLITVLSFLVALGIYAFHFGVEEYEDSIGVDQLDQTRVEFDPTKFLRRVRRYAYGHLSAYVGVFLVLLSFSFFIGRYELVFSQAGVVFGVGSVEAVVESPLLLLLTLISFVGGIAVLVNVRFEEPRVVYGAVGAVLVVALVGNGAGFIYQEYVVEPDELNKEDEFLKNEIEFTRAGFALNRIDERDFDVSENLTREQIDNNPGTIDNLRLWDKRPLMRTYNEQNNLRTYYHFPDIKTDRYEIDGELRQVYISAREIEFDALRPDAQTWVNEHLVYTHGMGFVMSPVSEIGEEGFPEYYVDEIPPEAKVDLRIDQPRLYYGEAMDSYNIVGSGTSELDFPTRDGRVSYNYTGDGGVPISSTFRQIAYAVRFGDHQIYFSDSVTSESATPRIQMNRDLETRVKELAPFLKYDGDPYPVVVNGRVKWIYDAYTTTDSYPYSSRTGFKGDDINYLRNSVKVVVDAYSGETTFYVFEEGDPIVNAYRGIFPSLFEDESEMPPEVREHVRYPQDAFQTQAEVNLLYHMQDPEVFYNKEDEWRIPNEKVSGETIPVEPYYIVMKLPGEEEPEFIQILPFRPEARQNLIGWMAARSDEPNYGEIESFLLSQQELIFGPQQVEARIDQNTEISRSITLWSRAGSGVDRGNLLAIPIDDTILYVEPLFLEAQSEGALPQLQRVIVAHNDRVTMQRTLQDSLNVLFGESVAPTNGTVVQRPVAGERIERIRELYREADEALREGDLGTYDERIEEIGSILEEFEGNATTTPEEPTSPIDTPGEDELGGGVSVPEGG